MKRHLLVLLVLLCGPLHGQEAEPEEDRAALDEARQRLDTLGEPATDEDREWKEALSDRIRLLEELLRTRATQAALPARELVEERGTAAEAELEALRASEPPESISLATADELAAYEQASLVAEAERVKEQSELDDLVAREDQGRQELSRLPHRGEDARVRMGRLTEADDLTRYRSETARLEGRVATERTSFLTEALNIWAIQKPVLQLELDLNTLQADRARDALELARAEAARLREAAARAARESAEAEARRAALEQDPIERFRGNVRAEVARLEGETTAQQTEIQEVKQAAELARASMRFIETEREVLENRLKLRRSGTDALLRRTLELTQRARRNLTEVGLPELYTAHEENQARLAVVLDRIWDLGLPPEENDVLRELLAQVEPERHDEAQAAFEEALSSGGLVSALRARQAGLDTTDVLYAELEGLASDRERALLEMQDYIRTRMFWIQSDPPFDAKRFAGAVRELASMPAPYRQDATWSRFLGRIGNRFPIALGAVGVLVGLHFVLRRLRAWKDAASEGGTLRRLSIDLARSALPPAQLWIAAVTIEAIGGPEAFDPVVPTFLRLQALLVLIRRLATTFLGHGGMAVGAGKLVPAVGAQLVRSIRFATVASQILYVPYRVLVDEPFHFEHFPRVLETLWLFCVAVSILLLLRRNGALVQHWTRPRGSLRALIRALGFLGNLTLVPIIALDAMGYRVAAERAMVNGLRIFLALFALGAFYRIMEQAGRRIAARIAARIPEEEADLRETRANAARVLSRVSATLVIVVAAVLLQQLWGIGEPAYNVLSSISIQIREVHLTGWDIALAIFWITGGHVVARNLGRIHKALVAPLVGAGEVGGRFAALTLLRYLLVFVAYVAAMLTMGFSFSSIGWFVTAASVGLGFGLQEIVANFISGLILLFEQPIRVGDIVSVGATGGTVEKITMRATVVTNWERQTIVIPNKKFVTENLTNWTRHDRVMRRTMDVRVAYGSDVEKILRILDQIVGSHPDVLSDPPHRLWFQSFGEFGIEFQIWFFSLIEDGLRVRSDLHAMINERFALEGIEIPVLQRDFRRAEAAPDTSGSLA